MRIAVCGVRIRRRKALLFIAFLIIVFLAYGDLLPGIPTAITLPSTVNTAKYRLLQPHVTIDFPEDSRNIGRIPHIIHQTSKTTCVVQETEEYIQSFVSKNPEWQYYFWTDSSARKLIADKYSELLHVWDNVSRGVKRGDILRYVVLYEFGGVYADIDVENLRSLDRATNKYSCIFAPEPFEHSIFLYDRPYVINNAIILCSPKHPFLKKLIESLLLQAANKDVMESTGPIFVTNQLKQYANIRDDDEDMQQDIVNSTLTDNSPFVFQGSRNTDNDSFAVHIPNTHYFTDQIDVNARWNARKYQYWCSHFYDQSKLRQRACVEIAAKGLHRIHNEFTFTKHHWIHTWTRNLWNLFGLRNFIKPCKNIMDIVPKAFIYRE